MMKKIKEYFKLIFILNEDFIKLIIISLFFILFKILAFLGFFINLWFLMGLLPLLILKFIYICWFWKRNKKKG